MNKNKLHNLIRLSNHYYKLTCIKYATPLDEDFVSSHSEFAPPNTTFTFRSQSPENQIMPSNLGNKPLPEYSKFKEHYSKTKLHYRIIHLGNFFGLETKRFKINPPTVDEYKNMIKQSMSDPNLDEEAASEGQQLLENFDSIFDKNAINIVANKFSPNDQVTAEAIDHDIGHRFLDQTGRFIGIDKKHVLNNLKQALQEEYEIRSFEYVEDSNGNELIEYKEIPPNNIIDKFFKNKLGYNLLDTLITNNRLPGSISNINLSENVIDDLSPDLLVIYNKNKETFQGLQFNGFNFYTNEFVSQFSLNTDNFIDGYFFTPKDINIPKINQVIKEYLADVEKIIKSKMSDLVGKVVILWTRDEPY